MTNDKPKDKPFTRKMLIKEMRQRFEYLLAEGNIYSDEFDMLEEFFINYEDEPADEAPNNERISL